MQNITFDTSKPKHLAILTGVLLGFNLLIISLASIYFSTHKWHWRTPIILRSPITVKKLGDTPIIEEEQEPTPTPTPEPEEEKGEEKKEEIREVEPEATVEPEKITKVGFVSFYSHAGCLGCHPDQITKSGEPFDENAMTLAIPAEWESEISMGTMVKVTNLDNGKSVEAKVNDTGGFWKKYNRIADLSLALAKAIDAKTDQSTISLEVI